MNLNSAKYLVPINNYEAVKEKTGSVYPFNHSEDLKNFLNFWQDTFELWKQSSVAVSDHQLEEKIRIRKSLINYFGIRK